MPRRAAAGSVAPDPEIRVSPRLRGDFQNGRRYYAFDGPPLRAAPAAAPSTAALEWHDSHVFRR